jgi:hypothetical protein
MQCTKYGWIEHGRQRHVEAERITRKLELAATATG